MSFLLSITITPFSLECSPVLTCFFFLLFWYNSCFSHSLRSSNSPSIFRFSLQFLGLLSAVWEPVPAVKANRLMTSQRAPLANSYYLFHHFCSNFWPIFPGGNLNNLMNSVIDWSLTLWWMSRVPGTPHPSFFSLTLPRFQPRSDPFRE